MYRGFNFNNSRFFEFSDSLLEVVRQADIVVLDWRLKEDDPGHSLDLLLKLVSEVDRNSLRLVSFYTGEAELEGISEKVFEGLKGAGLEPVRDTQGLGMSYRHGRVVLYAKPGVALVGDLGQLRVAEKDLAERLVEDFTEMTEGLLPHIALTSLAAVRECAHKVLDRFNSELDPAFMAHRASLPNPEEAERQIVSHVAEGGPWSHGRRSLGGGASGTRGGGGMAWAVEWGSSVRVRGQVSRP